MIKKITVIKKRRHQGEERGKPHKSRTLMRVEKKRSTNRGREVQKKPEKTNVLTAQKNPITRGPGERKSHKGEEKVANL